MGLSEESPRLALGSSLPCTVLAPILNRCRYRAFSFSMAWVLLEVHHLDETLIAHLIAKDEASTGKLGQHLVDASIIVGQDFSANTLWTVFQAPGPVSKAPQAGEQQARQRRAFGQHLVSEKPGFDVSGSCHVTPPSLDDWPPALPRRGEARDYLPGVCLSWS